MFVICPVVVYEKAHKTVLLQVRQNGIPNQIS